jgi:hypothetical protein
MAQPDLREIPADLLQAIPESLIRMHEVLPIARDGETLVVAYAYELHLDIAALENTLRFALERAICLVPVRQEEMQAAIHLHFSEVVIDECGLASGFRFRCPQQWRDMVPTEADGVRYCTQCEKPVYLCTSTDEALEHACQNHCVAIPASPEIDMVGQFVDGIVLGELDVPGQE